MSVNVALKKGPQHKLVCVHERWLPGRGDVGVRSSRVSQSWPDVVYTAETMEMDMC